MPLKRLQQHQPSVPRGFKLFAGSSRGTIQNLAQRCEVGQIAREVHLFPRSDLYAVLSQQTLSCDSYVSWVPPVTTALAVVSTGWLMMRSVQGMAVTATHLGAVGFVAVIPIVRQDMAARIHRQ